MKGADGIFAIGDCTATSYAPTAQVASQEGAYLARVLQQLAKRDELHARAAELQNAAAPEAQEERAQIEKRLVKLDKIRPFKYSHQGSLAYIGSDKAIADLPLFNGNVSARVKLFAGLMADDCIAARHRRCRDVPLLAQCLHQHPLLVAEPHARGHRLAEG